MPMLIYTVQTTHEIHSLEEERPIDRQEDQGINFAHQSLIQCKRRFHSKADVLLAAAVSSSIALCPCSFC